MKKRKLSVDPLHGNIMIGMVLFALPIMGTAFLQMLFTSVDTMVIGKFGSENAMASVGATSSIISLIISAVSGLSTAISILVGQQIGKGDTEGSSKLLHGIPLSGLCIGAVTVVLVLPFAEQLLGIVNCPETLLANALLYFRIYFLSVPFMLTFSFFSSYLHAKGNSVLPFVVQVSCGALNLVLNLLFVIVLHMDVAGVAIATVISQAVSAAAVLLHFVYMDKENKIHWRKLTLFAGFRDVFKMGLPASLENVVMNLSGVVMQSAINGFPEDVISGNTVAASIEGLMCIAFIGFSSASMVFISQNYSSGDMVRTKKVFLSSMLTVLILGELLGFAIYGAADLLTGFYTNSPTIAAMAKNRLMYMCLPYGLCGTMNVMSGCVRGLGSTKIPLFISVICSCLFRIAWIYAYAIPQGTVGAIYFSYPVCWLLATVLYVCAFSALMNRKVCHHPA